LISSGIGQIIRAECMFLKMQVNPLTNFLFLTSLKTVVCSQINVFQITVDFVKQNGLVIGDSITLYEDECKNLVSFLPYYTSCLNIKVGLKMEIKTCDFC
jgi:hypothetical protein